MQEDAGRFVFRGHNVTGDWFPQRHLHGNYYIPFVIKFGTFPPYPERHLTVHKVDEHNCLVTPLMCLLLWVGSLCGQLFQYLMKFCGYLLRLIEVLYSPHY